MLKKLLLIGLFAAFSLSSYSQSFKYTVSLDENSKQALSDITEGILPFNTSIDSASLVFNSVEDFTSLEFKSIVENKGYTMLSFQKEGHADLMPFRQKTTNCGSAQMICSNTGFGGNNSGFGTQELHGSNRGCLQGNEHQSAWYYINVETAGTLGMSINPNAAADYDFAIWGPFTSANVAANCAPTSAPIRCSWTQYPRTGGNGNNACGTNTLQTGMQINNGLPASAGACGDTPFIRHLTVQAGEIYILLIDNFNASNVGYTVNWSGTAGLGCTPVILPVEVSKFEGRKFDDFNHLSWTTESENGNDYFLLERSVDNAEWSVVDNQSGAGYSTSEINYSFNDYNYRNTVNYYRLSQVDYDGKVNRYSTVAINNTEEKKEVVNIINMMGQEVASDFSGARIIIYSDGTRIRKIGN